MYKKVVVGVAIISSPIQTYITYLAVRAGWDKAQIARYEALSKKAYPYIDKGDRRTMLYYLIKMNPTRDFTLHVSTNSSAMVRKVVSDSKQLLTDIPLASLQPIWF